MTGLGYSPPWCVNAGFVVGNETTLVLDTGGNWLAGATVHGYASAVRPANRLLVLNLEKHFDHIGGNGYFAERGAEILGHVACQRSAAEFREEKAEFNATIPNATRRARGEAEAFFVNTRLTNPGERRITEDTRLDLGGCEVEILLTPGHTPTNLSAWVADERVLYAGDCLISGYLANLDDGGPEEWRTWLRSLDRISALEPRVVVAGHGAVMTGSDVPRMIRNVRATLEGAVKAGVSPTGERG